MRTHRQLLEDLHAQAMREGEEKLARLLVTWSRHDGIPLVTSEVPRERATTVNIDPNIYAYAYEADLLCPCCTLELLIEQGKVSPAGREIGLEAALDQIQEADAAGTMERLDSERYPQPLGAYAGLGPHDTCSGCFEHLYA